MIINYDTKKINKLLKDFYQATGINMELLKADFSYVSSRSNWGNNHYCKCIQGTVEGKAACLQSDICLLERCKLEKIIQTHICHAGLIDIAVPILYNDDIIGYIIFGQIKTDMDFSALEKYIIDLKLNKKQMNKYYDKITFLSSEKIQSISAIASVLVKHILLENMLRPDFDEKIQRAVTFINDNLESELSVQIISKSVNVSKSVLYERFREFFNCTLSEYINKNRIEKSIELLTKTDFSIEEISQKVGFSSASYYGKIFKMQMGVAPLKYRKEVRKSL